MSILKCPKCGAEIEPGIKYCRECGTKILTQKFCRECGSPLQEGVKFCSYCGAKIEIDIDPAEMLEQPPRETSYPESFTEEEHYWQASYQAVNSTQSATAKGANKENRNKTTIFALLCVVAIIFIVLAFMGGNNSDKDSSGSLKTAATDNYVKVDSSTDYVIEKGTEYAFMSDEWNVYIATAISDSIIKIEHWDKTLQTTKSMTFSENIGSYKINESENGFTWLDNEHTAFTFIFSDKNNSSLKKAASHTFTININDSDKNKGTNYDKSIACYTYTNDDWHMYRAIPLTDSLIKIECWARGLSIGEYLFGWDWCIIDINDTDTDFNWTDDEHTSFTITTKDPNNSSYWEDDTFVVFEIENSDFEFSCVYEYLYSRNQSGSKVEKNDFFESANSNVMVGNFIFSIPDYWNADIKENDHYRAYAERSGKFAMLQIMLNYDDNDPVTYDILREETENGKMAKSFDSWFTSHSDILSRSFDNGSIKGFVYQSDVVTAGYDGKFECLVFPSEDDNSWIFVAFVETANTEFTYFGDFEKILDSITVSNL